MCCWFRPGARAPRHQTRRLCVGQSHLIFARITGWGQELAPLASAGHDINFTVADGALAAFGAADRPPMPPLNSLPTSAAAASQVRWALWWPSTNGERSVIRSSMLQWSRRELACWHRVMMLDHEEDWQPARPAQSFLLDGGAFYRCYETSDGKPAVRAIEPPQLRGVAERAGLSAADACRLGSLMTGYPQII